MRFDIMTLFPDMMRAVFNESILGRAQDKGIIKIYYHNIRNYSADKWRRVDDYPYGGGNGMIMQPMPIYDCFMAICKDIGSRPYVIYMSPKGRVLDQTYAVELSKIDNVTILCGHYEGVDERIIEKIVDAEVSIGDYVLTGGEIPAMALVDCICRMLPGVLADEEGYKNESHFCGLLEYPQYTRPPEFMGMRVPEILLSGHHANIEKWRRKCQLERTLKTRPDLIERAGLTKEDKDIIKEIQEESD